MASRIPVPTLLALAGKESSQEADEAAAYASIANTLLVFDLH